MVTRKDKIVFVVLILLGIGFFFFLRNKQSRARMASSNIEGQAPDNDGKKDKKKKKKKGDEAQPSPGISITQKWDMPGDLTEISGLTALSDGRFACVQDEVGTIYIFNTATNKVEREVPFGDAGDYEGIAVAGNTAYVLRADGRLFEVADYLSNKPQVRQYATHLTVKQDVEGLCFDAKHNRLLLAVKGEDPTSDEYKGVYAFDLARKELSTVPAYRVTPSQASGKGKAKKVQPSGIVRHPGTNELYIVDGPSSRLIIMGDNGAIVREYQLDTDHFPQPEGVAFTPEGELYICNEGGNGTGNILKISMLN